MGIPSAVWKLGLLATLLLPGASTAVMPTAVTRVGTDFLPAVQQLHETCQRECAGQPAIAQLVPSSQRLVQIAKQLRRPRASAAVHEAQVAEARRLLDRMESGFRAQSEPPPGQRPQISPTAETWDVHIGKGYVYFAPTPQQSPPTPARPSLTALATIARCRAALGS